MRDTEVQPLVSDDLLAAITDFGFDADPGDVSAAIQSLPEICEELLLWRRTAETRPFELAMALRGAALEELRGTA